jgi:hypothetical protein
MLHLVCRIHENSDSDAYGRLQRIGYMQSPDFGANWQRSDGTKLELPVTAESIETLSTGGVVYDRVLQAGGVAVDEHGRPHVVYGVHEGLRSEAFLAVLREPGKWTQQPLTGFLPEQLHGWSLANPAGVVFAPAGEMIITLHRQKIPAGEEPWGHASNEVVQLVSRDGGSSYDFRQISQPDQNTAHWLANVERPGLFHSRSNSPGLLYTAGPPGAHLKDNLSNEVWWVG